MRILHIATTFPQGAADTAPGFVRDLCLSLEEHAEIHVLAPHARGLPNYELDNGLHVHRFRYAPVALETLAYGSGILSNLRSRPWTVVLIPLFLLGMAYSLFRLHRTFRYELLHAHWWLPCGLVAAATASIIDRATYTPLIVTCHGGDVYALENRLTNALLRYTAKRSALMVGVSTGVKTHLIERGIDPGRIRIGAMGADLRKVFVPPSNNSARKHIVFVGRMVEKKGADLLLSALPLLNQCGIHEKVIFVGDGDMLAALKLQAKTLGVSSQSVFVGGAQHAEIAGYFQQAKLAVFPFRRASTRDQDGLGLVMVEAMGCECPVVASDLDNTRDVIREGETGYLFKTDSVGDLSNVVHRVISDDIGRKRIATTARQFALERFDWQVVAHNYKDLYNETCNEAVRQD